MAPAFNIPPKIRAAVATDYGDDFDDILTVQDDAVATPRLGDEPPAGFRDAVLVRVLAVALAPGDVRVMSGKTREFQGKFFWHIMNLFVLHSTKQYQLISLTCNRATFISIHARWRCMRHRCGSARGRREE